MSSDVTISLKGVGKAYNIYARPEDRLKQMLFRHKRYFDLFWALKGIDMTVTRGETVGIIGSNGSGKSTLLQIIAGTLQPTAGTVDVRGRVAALLELGTGFNPEFSGRENIFLNASILGLAQAEIESRFDRIAAFADIGQFIERPVKTYSSGMYARLAFAVAINVEPDILIVDEALAVGDEAFQRKCYARIRAIRDAGTTILFVTHAVGIVVELCDRAYLLDQGENILTAAPKIAAAQYQKLSYAPAHRREIIRREILEGYTAMPLPIATPEEAATSPAPVIESSLQEGLVSASTIAYPENGAAIRNIRILNQLDIPVNILVAGEVYRYAYEVDFTETASDVYFGMLIKTVSGVEVGGIGSHRWGRSEALVQKSTRAEVAFWFRAALQPGTYFGSAGVYGRTIDNVLALHRIVDAIMFRVIPPDEPWTISGIVDLSHSPKCEVAYRLMKAETAEAP